MSFALVKQSLDLVETPFETVNIEKEGNRGSEIEKASKPKYRLVKHIGVEKKQKELRGVKDVRQKNLKTVEQVKKTLKSKKDVVEENVKRLLALSQDPVDTKIADLLLKRLNKPPIEKVEVIEEPQTSVFTEEDFAKFEREYFVE